MNTADLKILLKKNNLHPIKKFGQNFLINPYTIQKITSIILKHSHPFVEIGPGFGALTNHFEKQKQHMLLIEKDKKLAAYWENKNYSVIAKDVLKLNWEQDLPKKITLFGNLPYQIAASLIIKSCLYNEHITNMIIMVQKEVAERVQAQASNSNILSIMSQSFWDISFKFHVSKTDFYPVPQVDGTILQFQSKKIKPNVCPVLFLKFVKMCFASKRKLLFKKIPHPAKEVKQQLKHLNLSEMCRAENCSYKDFLKLYSLIKCVDKT